MGVVRGLLMRLRAHAVPLAVIGVAVFFVFHAVHGRNGLLAYFRVQDELAQARAQADRLAAKRRDVAQRVDLLQPGGVHPDMLEEQARTQLNYARPDEVVVLLPGEGKAVPQVPAAHDADPGAAQTAARP